MWTIEDIEELMRTPAELDPELAEYLDEDGPLGPSMRHPLVYEIAAMPQMNAMMNERLKAKKTAVREALQKRDWNTYVYLHERPWRIDAFCKIAWRMGDSSYWRVLGSIFVDTENLWQNYDTWVNLLQAERRYRSHMMTTEERTALRKAHDPVITVYRGWAADLGSLDLLGEQRRGPLGLSWTTDKSIARFFARRGNGEQRMIATGTVERRRVLAHFTGRSESEMVVLPGDVWDVTMEEMG